MAISSLKRSTLRSFDKYVSMLAGNVASADYELISTTVLGSAQASVTFSGLNTGVYKHLQLRMTGFSASAGGTIYVRFNGDSASNYAYHYLWGSGSSVGSGSATSTNLGTLAFGIAGMSTTVPFAGVMDILDAFSTTKNKTTRASSGRADSSSPEVELNSGVWLSTAALTSLVITPTVSFATASRFSLYGVK